jgi:hypothetical protein
MKITSEGAKRMGEGVFPWVRPSSSGVKNSRSAKMGGTVIAFLSYSFCTTNSCPFTLPFAGSSNFLSGEFSFVLFLITVNSWLIA